MPITINHPRTIGDKNNEAFFCPIPDLLSPPNGA
jgi:hypothetical protein